MCSNYLIPVKEKLRPLKTIQLVDRVLLRFDDWRVAIGL